MNVSNDFMKMNRRKFLTALSASAVGLCFADSVIAQVMDWNDKNAFEMARENWRYQLIGSLDTKNMATAQIEVIGEKAKKYIDTYVVNSNRTHLWSDLPLDGKSSYADSGNVSNTMLRVLDITKAYKLNVFSENESKNVLKLISDALEWMSLHTFNKETKRYGNWYDWDIGVPQRLNDILVLLSDEIDKKLTANFVTTERLLTPEIPRSGTLAAAANRLLFCDSVIGRAILTDNITEIEEVKARLSEVMHYAEPFGGPVGLVVGKKNQEAFFSNDGFYQDGSFIQHGQFPYIGNYGIAFLKSLAIVLNRMPSEMSKYNKLINDWVMASAAPWLWNGLVLDTVSGRHIATPDAAKSIGTEMISTLLYLYRLTEGPEKKALASLIKAALVSLKEEPKYFNQLPVFSMQDALKVVNDPAIPLYKPDTGYHVFSVMDRTLYRSKQWAVSFAMNSYRMANYETGKNENLRGWYQADAATFLYTDDRDQYDNGYWCTINSYHLPGTTIDTVERKAEAQPWRAEYHNPTFIAGGATAGSWGSAIFDLSAEAPSTLTAKISRFFFEDCYVCTGSSISTTSDRHSQTTIENCRLTDRVKGHATINGVAANLNAESQSKIVKNARYIHIDNHAGYQLLQPMDLAIYREDNAGAPRDISQKFNNAEWNRIYKNTFLNVIINHDNSKEDTYAYAVYPKVKHETLKKLDAAPDIKVLKNNDRAHSVLQKSTRRIGINTFAGYQDGFIEVDGSCSILIEHSKDVVFIDISNPSQDERIIKCVFSGFGGMGYEQQVESLKISNVDENKNLMVQFDTGGLKGQTKRITLHVREPGHRSVLESLFKA